MLKTVRSKFSMVYISLVIIIILLGLISSFTLSEINKTINGLITTNYNSITRLTHMKEALLNQNLILSEYLQSSGNRMYVDAYLKEQEVYLHYYEEEKATIIIPAEKIYIREIGESYQQYSDMFTTLLTFDLDESMDRNRAFLYYRQEIRDQQKLVECKMKALYTSNEVALFARRDEAATSASQSLRITAVVFFVAAVGGYFLATVYTRRFFAPLLEITENVKLIREGNLDQRTRVLSDDDEFAMLTEEFNNMVSRLAEFERNAKGSLISEKNKSDSLVKSIQEPLILLDESGLVVLMNQAFEKSFGLSEETALGRPLLELVSWYDFGEYIDILKNEANTFRQDKVIAISQDGDEMFYHITATPVPGPDNTLIGLILILHDVTEMKRLDRARGDYLATISHEFKTPLTSIVMGADLMSNSMIGPLTEGQQEIVDTIKEDSQRLQELVGEILELSRIESSNMLYRFSDCDICDIISKSIAQFEALAHRNGVAIHVDCPGTLPAVWADFTRITWVLNNLLSNSMKYTKSGDQVSIHAALSGNMMEVTVSDTGLGVPPEFSEVIFDKYVQVKGYDLEVRGSGLGLAAAREIINAHGGTIFCDTSVSTGSRFIFNLPLTQGK